MKNYEDIIKRIMQVLLNNPHYLTLDHLARETGASKRSVQNYLAIADSWIEQNSLAYTRIIRKQGQGVILGTDVNDRLKIEKLLHGKSLSIYADDNKRRFDMIKKLVILKEQTTARALSEHYYISRPAILSELEWVRQWLSAYRLELSQTQRGVIEVKGDEVSHRNAIAGYIDSYRLIGDTGPMVFKRRNTLYEGILENLAAVYPEDTVAKVRIIIESSEQKFNFFLTDDYFTSLLTHIVISVSRLISGDTVPEEFYPPEDEDYPQLVKDTAGYIGQCLETVFGIKVSDIERIYVCIHLVGFNAVSPELSGGAKIRRKIKSLATMMIGDIDSRLGKAFINDEVLFFDLCLHLQATVFRLQKGIYHRRVSRYQLSESDAYLYDAVSGASRFYWEVCGVVPDEEELLNVTYYLLLSVYRNTRKPKAILVCNEGINKRMELMEFIGKVLPAVEVADCRTAYQLKNSKASGFDFIISTEDLQSPGKPVVDLSTADRSDYAGLISDFLGSKAYDKKY